MDGALAVLVIPTLNPNGSVRVVVYDSKIEAMNFPGGDVHTYTRAKTIMARDFARTYVPVRSGTLYRSIHYSVRPRVSSVVGRVSADARHAAWVHEGTLDKAPIYGKNGRMYLPAGGGYSARKVWWVSGQKPQPFLTDALVSTMAVPYRKVL